MVEECVAAVMWTNVSRGAEKARLCEELFILTYDQLISQSHETDYRLHNSLISGLTRDCF